MEKKSIEDLIQNYLNSGGEITKLRYATQKDVSKSQRNMYHREKATDGSDRSKQYIEAKDKKESEMIFSKTERWGE